MKCDKCKWANWNRTKTGRLHPDKSGRCTYKIAVPELPAAFDWGYLSYGRKTPIEPSGGYIERGEELKNNCVYYEEN